MIPVDIWALILEHLDPWERTPFLLIRLSILCSSSRRYFTSPQAWRALNPYRVDDPYQHFLALYKRLSLHQKRDLGYVWQIAAKIYDFGSGGGDRVVYKLLVQQIPTLRANENKYYKMGLVVATAVSFWRQDVRKYAVDDYDVLYCTVQILPSTIRRANQVLRASRELVLHCAKQRVATSDSPVNSDNFNEIKAKGDSLQGLLELLPQWGDDEEVVYEALVRETGVQALGSVSARLKQNAPFLRRVLERNPHVWLQVRDPVLSELSEDKELLLEMARLSRTNLANIHRIDREIMLAAYSDPFDPDKASFIQRRGIVDSLPTKIIANNFFSAATPSERATRSRDRELIEVLVAWCGDMLEYASPPLQDDHQLVLKAVSNYGRSLRFASKRLRSNAEVVRAACANDGRALDVGALGDFGDSPEFMKELIAKDGRVYYGASERLKLDPALLALAIETWPKAFTVAPPPLARNRQLALKATLNDPSVWAPEFKNDREFVKRAIKGNAVRLNQLDPQWADDDEVALLAVQTAGSQLLHCSSRQRKRLDLCTEALWSTPFASFQADAQSYMDPELLVLVNLRAGWFQTTKGKIWI